MIRRWAVRGPGPLEITATLVPEEWPGPEAGGWWVGTSTWTRFAPRCAPPGPEEAVRAIRTCLPVPCRRALLELVP